MKKPLSLCIIRLSAIGDVCHTLAVVQAIQRQYPDVEITWIIGKTEAMLMQDLPNVTLIPFDKKSSWKNIFTIWKQLSHKRFDFLLSMQTAFRASILSLGIKADKKIGFNKDRAREMQWLFTNQKVEQTTSPHVLDGQMMFAKAIGVTDLTPKWQLPISMETVEKAKQWLDPMRKNVVISPCSSKAEKDWLIERYAEIANWLIAQNINVILVGSPAKRELEMTAYIQQLAPNVQNLVGKTSLKELAALLKLADLVISPDTGSAHIASIQGTPVIGLYAIHNPRRTAPYNDQQNVISVYDEVVQTYYGKPWQALPWATKAKSKTGENLMARISVESVKQKVVEILAINR
ncbi:lipopolysaccharide heptosyltransferase family protein [Haemophilus parahaemolyticus]|uniref:Lipopolysaccharide heptosyltransferase family protein n=2 Tax=Haemophilus parahaemolyticus TaxID=735 RepID=A0AAE6MPR0_HAEPH|nr:glycosyltransferase family 9 protein [Haemophilus parahaemolyticus]EIJ67485.1 putative lipopolysaccharide heptosyltransferase I [Haemophilus parahaemolyticus HK385]OOR95564.1 ADP-heptose--LPS heptosyltransferase I [Haemophilus parahaemolyticus]QEN11298.1 lipopolysaccharide heptosyltransferase family protein [Haemophilus parahaemolyticus]QRP12492.1 glycosyltransferase family 9 protein [Haemophilus parahaemolyticus]STO66714.1 ADP-heptose--lipooligosaccharide heptosyltransferase I [Haemophilus